MNFGPFLSLPCLNSLISLTMPTLSGDKKVVLGRGFLIKRHHVWIPKIPVEDEGEWERQEGPAPQCQKPGVRLTSAGARLGRGCCSPTEAHRIHSPLSTHIHTGTVSHTYWDTQAVYTSNSGNTGSRIQGGGSQKFWKVLQRGNRKKRRQERGGRKEGKTQGKTATESLSWRGVVRIYLKEDKPHMGRRQGKKGPGSEAWGGSERGKALGAAPQVQCGPLT